MNVHKQKHFRIPTVLLDANEAKLIDDFFTEHPQLKKGITIKSFILGGIRDFQIPSSQHCPGLERIRLNLRNPETKIADLVQAEAMALAGEVQTFDHEQEEGDLP